MTHPSNSVVQESAEKEILQLLSKKRGLSLKPEKQLRLGREVTVDIDGFDKERRVLCEVYAHIGRTRGGQPGKVAKDILKLVTVEKSHGLTYEKILCFADSEAASCVQGRTWLAEAVQQFKVTVEVLDVPPKLKSRLLRAQRRQKMVNR